MRLSNEKGFTLIELMIVIAIIGIILAVASTRFRDGLIASNDAAVQSEVDTSTSILYKCALMNCQASTGFNMTTGQQYIACTSCLDPADDYTVVHAFQSGVKVSLNPDPMVGLPTHANPVAISAFHEYGSKTLCYYAEPAELQTKDGLDPALCTGPTTYP